MDIFEYKNFLYEKKFTFAKVVYDETVGKGKRYINMDDLRKAIGVDQPTFQNITRDALAANKFTNRFVYTTDDDGQISIGVAANKRTPQPKTPKEVADKNTEKRQKGINEEDSEYIEFDPFLIDLYKS